MYFYILHEQNYRYFKKKPKIFVTGGYKGYGLAMMVEVLCGILSGANFGPNVRTWKDFEKGANLVSKQTVKQPLKILMSWQC